MPSAALVLASLSLALWLYLAVARGRFWRVQDFDDDTAKHQPPTTWPKVIAVVPARNEAVTIAQAVTSLLQQKYEGQFSVVLIDDHSEDHTAQIAGQAARALNAESRITIRVAPPLPAGWTGKLWALHCGTATPGCAPATSISPPPPTPSRTGELWALNSGTATPGCAPTTSISPPPPTASRTGELWALNSGTATAQTTSISPPPPTASRTDPNNPAGPTSPTYFWFTDADIVHAPDTLHRLVARAEHHHLDLVSLMVLLQSKAFPERALIPAFLFFFLKLYPPRWIADPKARTAGAAGGCILLRREALERIGGFSAIRSEVIDDCALSRAVKAPVAQALLPELRRPQSRHEQPSPPDLNAPSLQESHPRSTGRLWMGLTRSSLSLRAYTTFAEIRDLIARTAFTQLQYSALLLLATLLAMLLIYVAPLALLFAPHPTPRILAASTWLLMSFLYLPTIRFYRLSPAWAATLPLVALFYSYATFLSAARYYLGRGAQWKGRSQARTTKSSGQSASGK